jgi:Ca2+-binding RTX toxin-like protein
MTYNNVKLLFSVFLAVSILMMVSSNHKVLAAHIVCLPSVPCNGTNGNDLLLGTEGDDRMRGLGGDDEMEGLGGDDSMAGGAGRNSLGGGAGNDKMTGGPLNDVFEGENGDDNLNGGAGNDLLIGDYEDGPGGVKNGADVILGGSGDDKLFHSAYLASSGGQPLKSDGSKDTLDCGPGNDEAWINVSTDHDTAINCEKVHTE